MCVRFLLAACTAGVFMMPHAFSEPCCDVVELRQYTLKPGQRDALIELFDRRFVEAQEAVGMTIVGQFRDARRPDHFVWLRGFPDMERRHAALAAFYDGPVWAANRTAANETMLDSDDVLLLRPARPGSGFRLAPPDPAATAERTDTIVLAGIYHMPAPVGSAVLSNFERSIVPRLEANGVALDAIFITEPARNTYSRLPVREGEHVLVWFGQVQRGAVSPEWLDRLAAQVPLDDRPVQLFELEPTSRSLLGAGSRSARSTKHDFDFLLGSWTVLNHYLKARLQDSTEWLEFESRVESQPLLDGLGNFDRYQFVRNGTPIEGVALRLFDPSTGDWSIYWADTTRPGILRPPMVGRFEGDTGVFFGDEEVDGRKVTCRFLWTRQGPDAARWEQAFSDDGGSTWETNWVMEFRR